MSLNSSHTACLENEKHTLLTFKTDLIDPTNRLASWDPHHHPDCCSWLGVGCDSRTGHVISLDLGLPPIDVDTEFKPNQIPMIGGKINPCLSNLKELRYLDLSNNSFYGVLPYKLGNLSNLEYLNLGDTYAFLYVENLEWLSGLSLLKHLDLSWLNLSRASDWLHVVNRELPCLKELHLSGCELRGGASLLNVNFTSLAILDLSDNYFTNQMDFDWVSDLNSLLFLNLGINGFDGPIPDFIRNMTSSLRHLDLSVNRFNSSIPDWLYSFTSLHILRLEHNQLHGGISSAIGNMTHFNQLDLSWNSELEGTLPTTVVKLCELRSIDLSGMKLNQSISHIFEILSGCSSHVLLESLSFTSCHLCGQLPDRLGHFRNLKQLSLSYNSISGPIPSSLGQLSNLQTVDISSNVLEGVVSEKHFANLTKLRMFGASDNSLVLRVDPNWIPPFQLGVLGLGSWQIGPSFPLWLASQKQLKSLTISNSSISDTIPSWFWTFSAQFFYVDLSNNQISGHVFYPSKSLNHCKVLDLSFNNFSGPLPRLPPHFDPYVMDLSNNHFSGSLSHSLFYDQLNHTMYTMDLVLSNNLLSGEIPDCWIKWQSLEVLHLDGNRFSGKIPSSMGTLTGLKSLHLHKNMLQGEIPLSLNNCTNIVAINLANNELDGRIPGWLGYGLRCNILKFRV